MATVAGSSAESKALNLWYSYLVDRLDFDTSVLRDASKAGLISESQRSECYSETILSTDANKFVDHLLRAVNDDSKKYHIFVQVLKETGQASIASHLQG